MKANYFFLMLLWGSLFFGITACGDDEDDATAVPENCGDPESALEEEMDALNAAEEAYDDDPSAANCTAYKNAFQAYLNALKPYVNCPGLTEEERDNFNESIELSESNLDNICE